ncbi:molybdenum cofactor guanylyltransferase [Paenibacillus sp. GSMTC-2017]|uniref:molybdenum cofactor guanylyltransferase n=1 Tax=Paenibacillus sp. GSMTC-2017 TaxID=2794350 RepID=UPI0018D8A477|nr:molybdenum cofactor guanylyltransferase [Paenibacillus sp. GSMTC-2017]MBH5320305.1 molybdenum cofactor guanylyltransferase [Paenibacillus sp. GSMTC-2017]
MISESITGAILAGGPNTGMSGQHKALLMVGGETLIQRQIRIMREVCTEIIVITNTPKPFFNLLDPSIRIITDYFPGHGPLGGIHAALYLAQSPSVWVVGCDMPLLSAEVAKRLLNSRTESCQSVVPIISSLPLPLHAIYDKRSAETASKLLADGEKGLSAFLESIKWLGIPVDNHSKDAGVYDFDYTFHNQDDFEYAQKILATHDKDSSLVD